MPRGLPRGPERLPPGAAEARHGGDERSPLSSGRSRADGAEPAAKEEPGINRTALPLRRRRPGCPPPAPPPAPGRDRRAAPHPRARIPERGRGGRFPTRGRGELFSGLGLTGRELPLAARSPHTTPAAKPWASGSFPGKRLISTTGGFSLAHHPGLGPLQTPPLSSQDVEVMRACLGVSPPCPPPPPAIFRDAVLPHPSCADRAGGGRPLPGSPEVVTFGEDGSHFQVTGGEADDGRLVQLGGDGRGQGQEFGQFVEFSIFFFPSSLCCVLGFFLHRDYCKAKMTLAY